MGRQKEYALSAPPQPLLAVAANLIENTSYSLCPEVILQTQVINIPVFSFVHLFLFTYVSGTCYAYNK